MYINYITCTFSSYAVQAKKEEELLGNKTKTTKTEKGRSIFMPLEGMTSKKWTNPCH